MVIIINSKLKIKKMKLTKENIKQHHQFVKKMIKHFKSEIPYVFRVFDIQTEDFAVKIGFFYNVTPALKQASFLQYSKLVNGHISWIFLLKKTLI
jgi:hypothetical protein